MSLYRADTIVACSTPAGRGAIAIVRWSGRDTRAVAATLFRPTAPGEMEPWRMRLGTVIDPAKGGSIDQALGVFFSAPHSFTGEDTFEVHCHGSPIVVESVVAAAVAAGARLAERGEFTRRAVLNGKLDLLQAEAVADLIDAKMAAGAEAAWQQLQGALSGEFEVIRGRLLAVLADIEAQVDFSDDELPDADFERRGRAIGEVAERLARLLSGFPASRRRREGLRVVFTGKPNAGKSSLVNRLLGSGRMIVSAEPGTTRDVVEEDLDLGGIAFVLTDTAGIREAVGAAETEAVARAVDTVRGADLRVLVLDLSEKTAVRDTDFWADLCGPDTIIVLNKSDLAGQPGAAIPALAGIPGAAVLRTSARTGEGCDALAAAILDIARRKLEADPVGISRLRHRAALERALDPLHRAQRLAGSEDASELAAIELRSALSELAAISQPVDNEEVLDLIFSEFCIGK